MQSAPQVVAADNAEMIINEVAERQRRATNIQIFNAPEFTSNSGDTKRRDDLEMFAGMVGDLEIAVSACKVIRLGKPADDRPGLFKIVFLSSSEAIHILRNKN